MATIDHNKWHFVLRDKDTSNQGWWLKVSSIDELVCYMKETNPTRYEKVYENYIADKLYNKESVSHGPYMTEANTTLAVVYTGMRHKCNIYQAIERFAGEVAINQMNSIQEYGAIYINCVGGYTFMHSSDVEYAHVYRQELVWPNFNKDEIRIKSFPGGEHFYAYVGDVQVKEGSGNDAVLKWDTYDEAYQQALSYIEKE